MTPAEAISSLDRTLESAGQSITISRGTLSVDCTAFVRAYSPQELIGDIIQGDSLAVISPTDLTDWADGGGTVDARVPTKGDKCLVAGRMRNVQAANPFYLADQLVRVEIQLRG